MRKLSQCTSCKKVGLSLTDSKCPTCGDQLKRIGSYKEYDNLKEKHGSFMEVTTK